MKQAIDLCKLIEDFGSEERCRTYLEQLRWPDGLKCPKCQSEKVYPILGRNQHVCDSCGYQFSVTAGTIFHDTHLPLWKWFLATYLICESRKGMSANRIKRTLGVSYKTAWYLCHRIRAAMAEENHQLSGTVKVDETYIVDAWHKVSVKHLPAYLQEMTWRFNNRKNPYLFRDTMVKLLDSANLEYKELTAA